jgi:hypothetical protein
MVAVEVCETSKNSFCNLTQDVYAYWPKGLRYIVK